MPIPFIVIAGAIIAGVGVTTGTVATISAVSDNEEADKNNKKAKNLVEEAKVFLETARNASKNSLERLGKQKISTLQIPIKRFISLFEKIKNIEIQDSTGLEELSKFKIDKQGIVQLKESTLIAESVAKGVVGGSVAGGAIAFGAWSAATAFASASTGTAIATLSGAAATNATLAFFGGGAIAAGGAGIAAGTAVLGGLVAGPALALMGIIVAANASENLEKSRINIANARGFQNEINVLCSNCYAIQKQADMFISILIKLNLLFFPLLDQMESVINAEGGDFRQYSPEAKKTIAAALSHAQAIKAILDTPILDKDGKITQESQKVSSGVCHMMQVSA